VDSPPRGDRRDRFDAAVGGAVVVGFVLARAIPFARARVGLDFDSFDYLALARHDSIGGVLAAHRPPVYLLFLKLLGENRQLVTWVQILVALAAWVWLAAATARNLRSRPGRAIGFLAILFVGSSLGMAQWDRVIGTESLSISLGVTTMAAVLWWWDRWSPLGVAAVCASATLWALLRDANAAMVGVAGVVVLVVAATRRGIRRPLILIGVVALAASVGAIVSSNIGVRWRQPMQDVVTLRLLSSPERASFLLRHGLPLSRAEAHDLAGQCANPVGAFLCKKVTNQRFYDWIDQRSRSVYARSWFAFPATTAWEPLAHEREIIGIRLPVAEITGTQLHAGFAEPVDVVAFPRSPIVVLAWIAILAVGVALLGARRPIPLASIACALIALTYVHLWVVWNGDAAELARHGLAASLQLALGLWFLSIGLVDALIGYLRELPR
jgi:hypothetical protein